MDNKYVLLPITQNQSDEIVQLANHVFGFGASLLISKKDMWGFYATNGEKIVGAVLLEKGGDTEGFLAWIFVAENARGHRLASRLIDLGFDELNKKGLTKQFALVRDDNTASWNMFLKAGYKILPIHKTMFSYSLKGLLKRLSYSMLTGYSIWVKDDSLNNKPIYPKHSILKTILGSLFIGATLALYGARSIEFLIVALITVFGITLLRLIVAFPIARLYGPVRFMPSRGGFVLSFFVAFISSAWWPTFGFFVPKEDQWNIRDFKKNEGYQALTTWISLNASFIFASFVFPDIFASGLNIVFMLVIIYQMIPIFPFDSFDGAKVLRWNKLAYVIGLVISILTIIVFL
jgi:ribosomal protein S18 acetylase RimI-like enzyme